MLSNRWLRYGLAIGGAVYGITLLFPRYHKGAAFQLVAHTHIPWAVWTALFLIYALLLCFECSRELGYWAGFTLFGFFLVASLIPWHTTPPTPFSWARVAIFYDLVLFHVAAARVAVSQGTE